MALDWKIFTQRPYIKSLSLEEQVRLFRIANEKSIRYRTRSGTGTTSTPFTNTRSLSFDGTDDFISFSSAISLSGAFTISAWIKPTSNITGNNCLIFSSATSNQNKIGTNGANKIQVKLGGSTVFTTESGGNVFVLNEYQHMLIIRDSSNNITTFRNGAAFGSSVTNSNTGTIDSIGKFNTTTFLQPALVDEVAIFNTDQSSNVSSIYNSGVPGDLSSLSPLHWYRFEEGSGTTATDSGTAGNNGTIDGATYSTEVPT